MIWFASLHAFQGFRQFLWIWTRPCITHTDKINPRKSEVRWRFPNWNAGSVIWTCVQKESIDGITWAARCWLIKEVTKCFELNAFWHLRVFKEIQPLHDLFTQIPWNVNWLKASRMPCCRSVHDTGFRRDNQFCKQWRSWLYPFWRFSNFNSCTESRSNYIFQRINFWITA